jgi:hypothetical protein
MKVEQGGVLFDCDLITPFSFRTRLLDAIQRSVEESGDLLQWLADNTEASLSFLKENKPFGRGSKSSAWRVALKPDFTTRVALQTFGPSEDWTSECSLVKPSFSVEPFEPFALPSSEAPQPLSVVLKITVTDLGLPFDGKILTLPAQNSLSHVDLPSYVERLSYAVLQHFIAPFLPNVPHLGACIVSNNPHIKTIPAIAEKNQIVSDMARADSIVTLEEFQYGITLFDLMNRKSMGAVAQNVTKAEWNNLVWQAIATHASLLRVGLLQFDCHLHNLMVSFQDKPFTLDYHVGDVAVGTKPGRALATRIDWSESIPTKCFD